MYHIKVSLLDFIKKKINKCPDFNHTLAESIRKELKIYFQELLTSYKVIIES